MAHLRARVQDSTDDDLAAQVAAGMNLNAGVDGDQPMTRPNAGTIGRRYAMITNTYEIRPPTLVCYQYDVKIEPGEPKTPPRLNREIWNFLDKNLNVFQGVAVAYDGRSMAFSPRKLPADEGQWSISLPDEDGGSSGKNEPRLLCQNSLHAPDRPRAARHLHPWRGHGHSDVPGPVGRPERHPGSQRLDPARTLDALSEPRRFLLPAASGPSCRLHRQRSGNVEGLLHKPANGSRQDVPESRHCFATHGAVWQPPRRRARFPSRFEPESPHAAHQRRQHTRTRLNRFLKGLKVQLVVPGREGVKPTRKIRSVEPIAANDPSGAFEVDGQNMTIETYFQRYYNVTLRRPELPCISVSKIARWPLELCNAEAGQKWRKKLDQAQTADAIRLTTVEPSRRVNMLNEGLQRIQPTEAALGQWEVAIAPRPMQVEARELPPPTIQYKSRSIRPRDGVWDVKGQQFHKPATINSWLVIVFDSSQFFSVADAQTCITGLVTSCTRLGIQIADRQPEIHYWPNGADIPSYIQSLSSQLIARTGCPPDLVVCFLPRKPCDAYGGIKRFGDQSIGVATQCMFENKAKKGGEPYFNNLALKVNVKLQNGINSVLQPGDLSPIVETPTMVCGGDVSHASPGSPNPSVAAVVGSMDPTASIFDTAITVQPSRLELIAQLEAMMIKLLRQFYTKNHILPERILFFRDGISEGQFSHVLQGEVTAIRMAVAEAGQAVNKEGYAPKLTFICCGKRHHISLFPTNPRDGDVKTGNAKSGTVIDNGIVSPFHYDWYCMSHKALLGTGRSAHHTVLVDDSNFSADQLQPLVFNLCFTYAKATRAVSVPTPAFYASRLCTRAQLLLSQEDDRTTVISSTSDSSQERMRQRALIEAQGRLKDIHPAHSERLFFL